MTSRDDHERALFGQAMRPPYDLRQPFDAAELLDGFTDSGPIVVTAAPDSEVGRMVAEARRAARTLYGRD